MAVLLEIRNMSKHFGEVKALQRVSFSIMENEILGLIGPNGSGKTTLLEGITGLMPVDEGKVLHHGVNLSRQKSRNTMFYLPDGILPYAEMAVSYVLGFFKKLFNTGQEQFDRITGELELAPVMRKKAGSLSKGFNRRFLLAIALMSPQPLLILDEPFDGLDLRQVLAVNKILRETSAAGRTLLLSIHQLADAQRICNRFILLDNGILLGEGTLEDLRRQAGISEGGLEEVFLALT